MRERALKLTGPAGEGLRWLGTFHSISSMILRRHCELVGLKSSFTILDTDDQIRLCKQIIIAEGIDPKRWTPRYLASLIDGWKNRALLPDKAPLADAGKFANGRALKCYQLYQDRLKVLKRHRQNIATKPFPALIFTHGTTYMDTIRNKLLSGADKRDET